jgi:Bifunctional DNA primase/polymerase, N-terminal
MAVFLDVADLYVSLGFRVFPLGHGSKLPAIKGGSGFKDATDNPARIDAWAKAYPNCNVAIATGEPSMIVVFDVDPRNGGFDSLSKLASGGFLFPPCPTAKTGNNGRHMYFRQPPGLKSSKDRLGPGIDVKSTRGYVVAAPSWMLPSLSPRSQTQNCARPFYG